MPATNKALKTAANNLLAPQHYNAKTDEYEYSQGEGGASFVTIRNPIEEFPFASVVTTAGSKTYSNSKKKEVVITFSGTGTATFTATLISNGIELPVQGFRETGKPALLDSFSTNQIVTIEKPTGCDLKLSWTLPTGGNVSAKAVIS